MKKNDVPGNSKGIGKFLVFFILLLLVCLNVWIFQLLEEKENAASSFLLGFKDNTVAANVMQEENAEAPLPSQESEVETPQNVKPASDSQQAFLASSFFSMGFGPEGERVLFKLSEKKQLPIASLTKLMTALVVLKHYQLNDKVTISKRAMEEEGDQGSLKEGDVLLVRDLLYITLIESSNRAAYALSEVTDPAAFVNLMNDEARGLGLLHTHFADSTGLDASSYSSAEDIGMLSQYLFLNYPLFKEIVSHREFDLYLEDGKLHHKLVNTNKFLGEIEDVVGGKTGWTVEAKGCLMVFQRIGDSESYRINVILGADDRFLEMQKLIDLLRSEDSRLTL